MASRFFAALGGLVFAAFVLIGPAGAASPWDGEWEGQLTLQRLCSPCKVRLTVQDGVPNIRTDVSIPNFTIDGSGQVSGQISSRNAEFAAECSLRGSISGDTLNAGGKCINASAPQMVLKRVSSSAGLPPAPSPAAPPSAPSTARVAPAPTPATPSPSPAPAASADPPPGRLVTPPTPQQKVFGAGTQALRLAELTYDMPEGAHIGELQLGSWLTSCGEGKKIELTRKSFQQPAMTGFQAVFSLLGKSRGYTVSGPLDNNGTSAASYLIAGHVVSMNWISCVRENSNPPQWSGSGTMTISWQVLRSSDGQAIYTTTTQTTSSLPSGERRTDGLGYLFANTFGDAVLQLIGTSAFRDAVRVPVSASSDRPRVSSDSTSVRSPPLFRSAITANMKAILPAIVEIRPNGGVGSGFIIDASGLIMTNAHVVRGFDKVTVVFADSDKIEGTVVKRDLARDVALIRVDKAGLKAIPIRRGEPVLTEKVYAVGSPFGLSQTVTEGIVSSYRRQQNGLDLIQATAAISPGNSGGPLLDASGNVIGISQFIVSPGAGTDLRFFIPIDSALDRMDLRLAGR